MEMAHYWKLINNICAEGAVVLVTVEVLLNIALEDKVNQMQDNATDAPRPHCSGRVDGHLFKISAREVQSITILVLSATYPLLLCEIMSCKQRSFT